MTCGGPQGNFRHTETHSAVSREELMMVLAGLQQLQIRALFSKFSTAVSLGRVALEVASTMGRGPPASNVELCMCPANYLGDSCQVRRVVAGTRARLPPLSVWPSGTQPSSPRALLLSIPWCHPNLFSHPLGVTLPAARPSYSVQASRLFICLLIYCHHVSLPALDPFTRWSLTCEHGPWSAPESGLPASLPDH